MNRQQELEKQASSLYSEFLSYHNFGHVLRVLEAGERILNRCRAESVIVDEDVVYYAMLFHDANYHEDEQAHGFPTKEAYSASLAGDILAGMHLTEDLISRVKTAILSTHVDAECRSNEDKLVRLADLSGMAGDYATFRGDTINLKEEYEYLHGKSVTWHEWKQMASDRIEQFLRQDMGLTSDYYDSSGNSRFHQRVKRNVELLMQDYSLEP